MTTNHLLIISYDVDIHLIQKPYEMPYETDIIFFIEKTKTEKG